MKHLIVLLLALCAVGCASRADRLNREYERLSRQIDAMQDEQKAVTRLEMSAQDYLTAKQAYEKAKQGLASVRERNRQDGVPLGPDLADDQPLEEEISQLKKNHDMLSDRVRELEKKREDVAKEQMESSQ